MEVVGVFRGLIGFWDQLEISANTEACINSVWECGAVVRTLTEHAQHPEFDPQHQVNRTW